MTTGGAMSGESAEADLVAGAERRPFRRGFNRQHIGPHYDIV